jgi:hypothetical protein
MDKKAYRPPTCSCMGLIRMPHGIARARSKAGARCAGINALQKKATSGRKAALLLGFARIRCGISQEEGGDKNHQGELRLQRPRSDVEEPWAP